MSAELILGLLTLLFIIAMSYGVYVVANEK